MLLKKYFAFIITLLTASQSFAQLIADAGNDKTFCPGQSIIIGGSPTAASGLPPYTYTWLPATGLNDPAAANPSASPSTNMTYTVTVKDDTGAVKTDVVNIYISIIAYVSAGRDTSICVNSSAMLGAAGNGGGITYSWSPGTTLNDSTIGAPIASPGNTSVTYTLTAVTANCPAKIDNVTVNVIPTPLIDAGPDVTIYEGAAAILHASGGSSYAWGNGPELNYIYTANCDAEPLTTTTYYLYGTDASGVCPAYDSVTVFVIPSDELVIYNTFTPNGDSNNDLWYIGNIYKYPDNHIEIYNRYGKVVYKVKSYQNNWDGKVAGDALPSGTYFYDVDLGNGSPAHHGTLTIVK